MSRRLVVRGGTVVDGTGLPSCSGGVEIVDGRITQVGRLDPGGAEMVDADGSPEQRPTRSPR